MSKLKLILSACLLVTSLFSCETQPKKTSERPNILFIFSDDHAYQAIGSYGSIINQTPNIDRLADQGMIFRNATVTNSICGPSRAVILTGKHSHKNGFFSNERTDFDGSQQTFPKLMRNAGYETAVIGKWHLGSNPTGFDDWQVLPVQGDYYNPDFLTKEGKHQEEGYVTDIITDKTIDWLENQRDPDKPFMLMSQHKSPHGPWMPALRHLDFLNDTVIPEPPTLFDDYKNRNSGAAEQVIEIANHLDDVYHLKITEAIDSSKLESYNDYYLNMYNRMTPSQRKAFIGGYHDKNLEYLQNRPSMTEEEIIRWKYQRYVKDYLRCVQAVDENIGRLLDYLEKSGLAENTIVIYSSDQGFYLGEHGWFDKRWMYKESFGTPLIIKWPGYTDGGKENTDLVQNLDYAETFLDLAGVEIPQDMQGRSLVPLLKDEKVDDWRDALFYHFYEYPGHGSVPRHYGVSTDRFKLIHYYQLGEWELFDLEQDSQEMYNLYGKQGYDKLTGELRNKLLELAIQYEDTLVIDHLK